MQYTNLIWRDGQPYSEMFDDIYYSSSENEDISGEEEFKHVFFTNNGLPDRWFGRNQFVIAELGLGSTLNCLLTIREWLNHCDTCDEHKTLHYIAIEKYPLAPQTIVELISRYPDLKPYCDELLKSYPPAVAATHTRYLFDNRVVIHYKFMDAYEALHNESFNVDAWYLDGFSPANNTDMWSPSLFAEIAKNSYLKTTCSTYTAAGHVKRSMKAAGFTVKKVKGFGRKREMLTAEYTEVMDSLLTYKQKPWFYPPNKVNVSEKKATVIGAGIAGLTAAYALIKRGWQVTIIDKNDGVAKETSSNPAAVVYPRLSVNNDTDTAFYINAYCYALHFLSQLKGRESFWLNTGLLQLFEKKRALQLIKHHDFDEGFFSVLESIGEEESCLPLIPVGEDKVYVEYEKAGVVLPQILCEQIKQLCKGKLTFIDSSIDDIKKIDNHWCCYSNSVAVNKTEVLILACGANSNDLLAPYNLEMEAIRGQVAILDANNNTEKLKQTVNAQSYITPSIFAKHYLGASYSRDSREYEVDQNDNNELLDSLENIYPDLFTANQPCDAWVGFRAMTKDRVPMVGAVPDIDFYNEEYSDICHGKQNKNYRAAKYLPGLFVSLGHGSRGFTSSYLCSEIIAAQIESEPLPVTKQVMDYLSPSRFIVNNLKKR